MLVLPATWKTVSVPSGIAATSEASSVRTPNASFGRKRLSNFRSDEGRCRAVTSQPRIINSLTKFRPTNPVPPVTKAARDELGGISRISRIRVVAQDRRQPPFSFVHGKSLALRIAHDLIAVDLADTEIMRLWVRKIKPADRRCRKHRKGLGQANPRGSVRIEKAPQQRFFGVVGAGWIPRGGPDALIFL